MKNRFQFYDFSGKLITGKNMPFVDATGATIMPVYGTPFVDGHGEHRRVGQSFWDYLDEYIEPR